MDTIFIEGLTIIGKHGIMRHEWSHEQRFLVDIRASFDAWAGAASDKLEDTLDYKHFCDVAREVIEGESVYLVEKLASDIAARILEDARVADVSVTIRKPTVLPSGVPGVTVNRAR